MSRSARARRESTYQALNELTPFRPSRWNLFRETLTYFQIVRLFRARKPQPERPTGVPVLLVPGFLAGDWSLRLLASRLREDGHATYSSGMAVNAGCSEIVVDKVVRRLAEVADRAEGKVAIVGQSRGGTLAKLAAIQRPELVSGIVTLGSPLLDPLAASENALKQAELLVKLNRLGVRGVLGADCLHGSCADRTRADLLEPFPNGVAFTSVYSKTDAVVDWRACLDPAARQIEQTGSHTGMATNASIYRVVRSELSELGQARRRR